MKRHIVTVLALAASVLTAGPVLGQNKSGAATPAAAPAPKEQKLVRVATINGIDANREFQANVQILQSERQNAVNLNAAMEKEKDPKKKAELKTKIDEAVAKLNDDNTKMEKAYGFSLARNYAMVVEVSHIYMLVSDEEAARVEKEAAAEAAKAAKEKGKKK
jgi:hypothetical protein